MDTELKHKAERALKRCYRTRFWLVISGLLNLMMVVLTVVLYFQVGFEPHFYVVFFNIAALGLAIFAFVKIEEARKELIRLLPKLQ